MNRLAGLSACHMHFAYPGSSHMFVQTDIMLFFSLLHHACHCLASGRHEGGDFALKPTFSRLDANGYAPLNLGICTSLCLFKEL